MEQRIDLKSNDHLVKVPMRPGDDLDWSHLSIPAEGTILWELDLGLEQAVTPLRSAPLFYTLARGIELFSKELLPSYRQRTLAVVLYCGDLAFEERICWEEEEIAGDKRLWAARLMADYLKRLLSFLPDDLLVVVLLKVTGEMAIGELMQLLSRASWEQLAVALSGSDLPVTPLVWDGEDRIFSRWGNEELPALGLLLPDDEVWNRECQQWVSGVVEKLKERFRVVPELLLTQDWEGLDRLVVHPSAITRQGARMVQGFVESGGTVV